MITDILSKFEKEATAKTDTISKSINILWVDDEVEFLRPYILYLNQNGYNVSTVSNGLDALNEFVENRYDIIFMDENMPGLSGIETIGRMKEINSKIPIVMITKNESERVMKEASKGFVADYMVKPVSLTQIFVSVHKILNRPRG